MANEFVINIYTDGTDWGDTIIAAPHNFLRYNILFASICVLIVKSEPRGKGESTNLISHHTPHLLPDQKHKPTAAKLHYALLIMAPKIFFQGVFPRNKCLKQGRRNKSQWWANGVSQVQHNLCTAAPVLTALSRNLTKVKPRPQHKAGRIHQTLGWWGAVSPGCVSTSFNWLNPIWDSISGNHKDF